MTPPPLGLRPRWLVAEQRIAEIKAAMNRYIEANEPIPSEWLEELHELLTYLRNRRRSVSIVVFQQTTLFIKTQ
jgi:hypothetical protein